MPERQAGKRKGKPGRKPSPDPKSEFIGLKVTAGERERLEREAAAAGMPLARWILWPHRARWDAMKTPPATAGR